jgi:hypothetical protein
VIIHPPQLVKYAVFDRSKHALQERDKTKSHISVLVRLFADELPLFAECFWGNWTRKTRYLRAVSPFPSLLPSDHPGGVTFASAQARFPGRVGPALVERPSTEQNVSQISRFQSHLTNHSFSSNPRLLSLCEFQDISRLAWNVLNDCDHRDFRKEWQIQFLPETNFVVSEDMESGASHQSYFELQSQQLIKLSIVPTNSFWAFAVQSSDPWPRMYNERYLPSILQSVLNWLFRFQWSCSLRSWLEKNFPQSPQESCHFQRFGIAV